MATSTPWDFTAVLNGSEMQDYCHTVAEEIVKEAKAIFSAQWEHAQMPTPPPYIGAFRITKRTGPGWTVENYDPASNLVEWGSHPGGGHTFTLRYRPLGRAVEVLHARR